MGFLMVVPILFIVVLILSLITIIFTIVKTEKYSRSWLDRTFLFEIVFMVIGPAVGFVRYDEFGPDVPFKEELIWILIFLSYIVIISYWISKISRYNGWYNTSVLMIIPLSLGLIITFITTIHFLEYMSLGIAFPVLGFELLSPFVCFLLLIKELKLVQYFQLENQDNIAKKYKPFAGYKLLIKVIVGLLFSVLFLAIFQLVISAFGYPFSTLIEIFTESRGFILSTNNLNNLL